MGEKKNQFIPQLIFSKVGETFFRSSFTPLPQDLTTILYEKKRKKDETNINKYFRRHRFDRASIS